jgi:hypothetical protein
MRARKADHDTIAIVMDLADHSLFPGDPLFLFDLAHESWRGKVVADRRQAVDELLEVARYGSRDAGLVDQML